MKTWQEFLTKLKDVGGSTDMQTSKTGRYPWLFHFCREQAASLTDVVIYAHKNGKVITSPSRNWTTKELILTDYTTLKEHGGFFNDTTEALKELA